MSKQITIETHVMVADNADPEEVAQNIFDILSQYAEEVAQNIFDILSQYADVAQNIFDILSQYADEDIVDDVLGCEPK